MHASKPPAAAAAVAPASGPGSSKIAALADRSPPLQLYLLPEVAQLGCLPGPEAAQLTRSPGRKQMLSGQIYCVDPGVGRHRHVKVRMCDFLFIFFAVTLQNTAKIHKNRTKSRTTSFDINSRKSTRGQEPTDQRTNEYVFGPVSFCR